MTRHYIIAFSFICMGGVLTAQTASEALRYSTFDVLGTARSMSTAGAMSPLGGDFSILNLNPAGTATYRGSEFTISPGYYRNQTEAVLTESAEGPLARNAGQLLLANVGFVIASRPRDPDWKTSNFAIGITKVADFHEMFEYSGANPGSLTDRYRSLAQGVDPDDLFGEASLAYNAGAIYDFEGDLTYESDYQLSDQADLLRRESVETSGYNTELLFAYGANYREKIQFGLGIGVPILSFEQERIYREDDRNDAVPFFNDLKYEEFISTTGSGFNFKAGVILKPAKWVNIGFAYHSRTRYALTDNFSSSLEYDFTDQTNDGPILAESPDGSFRYNLRSPRTWSGGIGTVIAKSAFLSTEIQYKNYGRARFDYSKRNAGSFEPEENAVNASIRDQLSDALTIRTGGEIAIRKFRVRGGVELDQSPYDNDDSFDVTYNAGLGFRGEHFFADLAYQYFTLEQGYLPYSVDNAPEPFVLKDISNNRLVLTFAFRWE